MDDPFELQRFVAAQSAVIAAVRAELGSGRKASHWMWFVFPQLAGLGSSPTASRYAIRSLDEARAYLAHPVLGARLRECTSLVLATRGRPIGEIFGAPDDAKFRSSMTLFACAEPAQPLWREALERFFGGLADPATLARL